MSEEALGIASTVDDTEALRLNGTEMAFEWADEWSAELLSDEFIKETVIGSTVSWMNLQNSSRIDEILSHFDRF